MGRLKQLVLYLGKPLILHAIQTASAAGFRPLIVVVGAQAAAVEEAIAASGVQVVENPEWELGMGSSISTGMRLLLESQPDASQVAILLGDQPLVRADQLMEMRALLVDQQPSIVAAQYSGTLGVPAIFHRSLFDELLNLPKAAGARRLFSDPSLHIAPFPLAEAALDIDTPADLAALLSRNED